MEIHYQNTRGDYQAAYDALWGHDKPALRDNYYFALCWYLAVLALAGGIAVKHGEAFAVCVFLILAAFYVRQN